MHTPEQTFELAVDLPECETGAVRSCVCCQSVLWEQHQVHRLDTAYTSHLVLLLTVCIAPSTSVRQQVCQGMAAESSSQLPSSSSLFERGELCTGPVCAQARGSKWFFWQGAGLAISCTCLKCATTGLPASQEGAQAGSLRSDVLRLVRNRQKMRSGCRPQLLLLMVSPGRLVRAQ